MSKLFSFSLSLGLPDLRALFAHRHRPRAVAVAPLDRGESLSFFGVRPNPGPHTCIVSRCACGELTYAVLPGRFSPEQLLGGALAAPDEAVTKFLESKPWEPKP